MTQIVTELVVDAGQASKSLAQFNGAMDKASAAVEQSTVTMTKNAGSINAVSRAYDSLRRSADPVYAAESRIATAQERTNAAMQRGVISAAEAARTMDLVRAKYDAASASANRFSIVGAGLVGGLVGGTAVAALTMLPRLITESVHAVGDLADAAAQAGASAEKLQVLRQALAQNGGEAESADAALRKLNVGLGVLAQTGRGPVAVAFKDLRLSIAQLVDLSPDQKFDVIAQRLAGISDPARRAAVSTELFGRSAGPQLAALLGQGSRAIAETEARMRELGTLQSNEMVASGDKLDDKLQELTQRFTVLFRTIVIGATQSGGIFDSLGGAAERAVSKPSFRTLLAFLDPALARHLLGAEAGPAKVGGLQTVPIPDYAPVVSSMQKIIDKSRDFDVAFQDSATATEELRKGFAELHPEAKATGQALEEVVVPLPRIRPAVEAVDQLGEAFKSVQGYAESFTQSLVEGLMHGGDLTDSLAGSLTNLSSQLANSAITNLLSGNIVGAAVSGIGALITGIFGSDLEEKKRRDDARRAWADMAGDVRQYSLDLRGAVQNTFTAAIADAREQFDKIAAAARLAGVDVSGLRKELAAFTVRERRAGRAAVIADISPQKDMSDYETEFRRLQDARASSVQLLHQLGLSLRQATMRVNTAIRASITDLRRDFTQDLRAQINEATGRGFFNEIQALADQNIQQLKDAQRLGVSSSLVNQAFVTQAQAIVDNERLTGGAFDELIARFPQLAGVVHEFAGTLEDTAARMDRVNTVARTIVDYLNDLNTGAESTLSPQARLAAAQTTFGGQLALAQSGNLDAQGSITKYADDLLKAARSVFASGTGFQDIFQQVQSQLIGLPAVQQSTDPVVIALRDAIIAIQGTTDAVTAQTAALSLAIAAGPAATAAALIPQFDRIAGSDHVIDFTEFIAALHGFATEATLQTVFTELDINGNGVISQLEAQLAADGLNHSELIAAINAGPVAIAGALLPHFTTLDTNVNGLLDVNELRAALGPLATNAQIAALITRVDTNGDGQISKLELVRVATAGTNTHTLTISELTRVLRQNSKALGHQFDTGIQVLRQVGIVQNNNLVKIANNTAIAIGIAANAAQSHFSIFNPFTWFSQGGIVGSYAPGGIVGGGFWNIDSVRARYAGGGDIMLAGGEGVINAAATRMIGPSVIDLINRTGQLPANDNGPHFALQNRVLATGFTAVVNGLRDVRAGLAELLESQMQLERRARIEASREPRRRSSGAAA